MKVSNWDTWQTFRKDRGTPPWIKVYRNLMTNEEWVSLSDSEKGQLVSIWIIAADKDGEIPDDPLIVQRMAMLELTPNLSKFIELGFLTATCQPSGNQVVTIPPEVDAPEKRREETDIAFDSFWIRYPRKDAKQKALSAWRSKKLDNKLDLIMKDLSHREQLNPEWVKGSKFVMLPTTYINGARWEDEKLAGSSSASEVPDWILREG